MSIRCSKCGNKISKSEKHCSNCGNVNKSRTSKKIMIILSCFILVVIAGIVGIFIYNSSKKENDIIIESTSTVTKFFEAYSSKNGEANSFLTYTSIGNTPITYEGYQRYCAEIIKYKIKDVKATDKETVTLTIDIENIDIASVLAELDKKTFTTDEEIMECFYLMLQEDDVPTKTYKCNVICKQYPTGVKILYNAELSNALLGGYNALVSGDNE